MPPSLRPWLVPIIALFLLAPAASAQGDDIDPSSIELHAILLANGLALTTPGTAPLRGGAGSATAHSLMGLRLWASGAGYAVGRRSAGYDLGAGAALPISDLLSLTAGYRLTGFSAGTQLEGEVASVDGHMAGAYFGFDLEF